MHAFGRFFVLQQMLYRVCDFQSGKVYEERAPMLVIDEQDGRNKYVRVVSYAWCRYCCMATFTIIYPRLD